MHLQITSNRIRGNGNSSNRHGILINYCCAPGESIKPCDGNAIGFSPAETFSNPASVDNSRPSTVFVVWQKWKVEIIIQKVMEIEKYWVKQNHSTKKIKYCCAISH